jgi:hypothetical protein
MIQPEIYKIADDYIADLERHREEEIAKARELMDFWCQTFPEAEFMPEDKRFFWWVRSYDMRVLKYAISVTATNLAHDLPPDRLGKYVSSVARNVQEQAAHKGVAA